MIIGIVASVAENGDNDVVTQYTYDTGNRVTRMITGLTAYSATPTGGATTRYSYDDTGYLSQITDPMGYVESYQNKYNGTVEEKTDKNGDILSYTYGAFGVKSILSENGEKKQYVYNDLGQLETMRSINKNGETVEEDYVYDAFGRMISHTANDGSV